MTELIAFNISGPYAVGKDTALTAILERKDGVARVSTKTTRNVEAGHDPSYANVSETEMTQLAASRQDWIVNYQLSGSVGYATSLKEIRSMAKEGTIAVHAIHASDAGAGEFRRSLGASLLSIALIPPGESPEEQLLVLKTRLEARGRETPEQIANRLDHSAEILSFVESNPIVPTPHGPMPTFDRVVESDTQESTIAAVLAEFDNHFNLMSY